MYKIRNKETNKFATKGTSFTIWTKNGAVWNNLGFIKTHLNHQRNERFSDYAKHGEIIKYDDNGSVFYMSMREFMMEEFTKKLSEASSSLYLKEKYTKIIKLIEESL